MDDSRTFNTANELTARDTDTNGTANHSPTYDAVGKLTAEAFPSPPSSAPGRGTSRSGSSS